jgi:glucose-6-phosphate dehydrogenase assembly protein OpcA
VIVDSATFTEPARALRYLADLSLSPGRSLALSDMAWTRLTTWRQMIAQFFDIVANQPCLEAIEDVQILYAARTPNGDSGLTAGLLTAAWLCTRLGWRAPGEELVRARDGWKLTLRAGARGRSREVILTLRSSDNPDAAPSLQSVTLSASGDHSGIFKVERVSEEGVQTTSETPTPVQRIVYARNPSHAALLAQELREFGADPIYNEALHFAANLWPEGAEG